MSFHKALLPLGLVGLLLWPGASGGRTRRPGISSWGTYQAEVVVDGAPRAVHHHQGHNYIEGRRGERYVIRVHNRSWRRVEAVVSVDGRDVIDGRPSSLEKRGYVIPPYSHIDVDGFRLSMNQVAAFRFTDVPDSYAARMGTPWEVGVIAVAVFPERVQRPRPPPRPPYVLSERDRRAPSQDRADDSARGGLEAAPRSRNLGTEFGERRGSPVSETRFARENWSQPAAWLSLRYDDGEGLCALGVGSFCYPPHPPWPPPYDPGSPREFAPPPPGWEHFSPWY